MTDEQDRIIAHLDEYMLARESRLKCVAGCYEDADWFCGDQYRREDEAGDRFFAALDEYIAAKVGGRS